MSRTETADHQVTIVAVHGVGDRESGVVLDAVLRGLSGQGKVHSKARWTYYQGHCYRHADVRGHREVGSVIEVNWDDISHPARSFMEHFTHFFSVLASTLRYAVNASGDAPASWPLKAYRWAFNALLIWCVFLPIATISGFVPSRLGQIAWVVATAAIVQLLAKVLSPYDERFRVGHAWAAGVVLVGLASIAGEEPRAIALSFATWTYGSIQGLAGLALLIAMGVTWWRSRTLRSEQRFARLAFLYLPFALFTGIGALVWAGTLTISHFILPDLNLRNWNEAYVSRLIYDLAFAEALLGLAVAVGGILLLLPARALLRNDGGARVHARLLTALKIFPLLVVVVFGLYVAHLVVFADMLGNPNQYPAFDAWIKPWLWPLLASLGMQLSVDDSPKVFEIYLASSLRLVPFLAYLIGPFRVMLDTVGDVLLYVDPEGQLGAGSVRERSQQRLLDALHHVIVTHKDRPVVVLAHSQGTAISADVLAEQPSENVCFVSLGSPISSLYWRFLGPEALAAPSIPWLNLFRTGDYIAGGQGIGSAWAPTVQTADRNLGVGRHSDYFGDPKVWKEIMEWLASSRCPH